MPTLQFIGAAIGASLVVIVSSLLWPRITSQPRPESLSKVHDVVLETEAGKNLANTLGVTDENTIKPVSLPSLAASAAQSVVSTVVTNTQNTITTRVIESLSKQFDQLPSTDQEKFRQLICTPKSE